MLDLCTYLFSNTSFSKQRMSMLDFGALNMQKLPCSTLPLESNKIRVELLGKLWLTHDTSEVQCIIILWMLLTLCWSSLELFLLLQTIWWVADTLWMTLFFLLCIVSAVVAIGAVLFAFQQFAGINAIFYFSSTVFKSAGVASDVGASVAVGVVNLLGELNVHMTVQPGVFFSCLSRMYSYEDFSHCLNFWAEQIVCILQPHALRVT